MHFGIFLLQKVSLFLSTLLLLPSPSPPLLFSLLSFHLPSSLSSPTIAKNLGPPDIPLNSLYCITSIEGFHNWMDWHKARSGRGRKRRGGREGKEGRKGGREERGEEVEEDKIERRNKI
jgi:hypothetical protein